MFIGNFSPGLRPNSSSVTERDQGRLSTSVLAMLQRTICVSRGTLEALFSTLSEFRMDMERKGREFTAVFVFGVLHLAHIEEKAQVVLSAVKALE